MEAPPPLPDCLKVAIVNKQKVLLIINDWGYSLWYIQNYINYKLTFIMFIVIVIHIFKFTPQISDFRHLMRKAPQLICQT